MTYHDWSDEWFEKNGKSLYEAMNYFTNFNRKYGRWCFGTKEKYGTMRLEYFWHRIRLDELLGYNLLFIKKRKLYIISNKIEKITRFLRIHKVIIEYHRFIFNVASLRTCQKWPEVKEEILHEHEFNELLYEWIKKKLNYTCSWRTVGSSSNVDSD